MKSEIVELSRIQENKSNPRSISKEKFQKLINSLLSLPQMLEMRPIVIDKDGTALGGNMRYRALSAIAQMSMQEINDRLAKSRDVKKKPVKAQEALRTYWAGWLEKPVVPVLNAADLSKAEQKEFIIKDNGDFGQWDYDMLANEWNADDLNDWGVDVWQSKEVEDVYGDRAAAASQGGEPISPEAADILANEQDNDTPVDFGEKLPAELQGVDLDPNNLPKIQGTDETPFERIIIVYPKERKEELQGLLGMTEITKVVYHLDEILGAAELPTEEQGVCAE